MRLEFLNQHSIAFGGAALSGTGGGYGFGEINDSEGLLKTAFDHGIRVFDTAPIYGFGLSEKRIGKAFSKVRDQVFVISKGGITWDQNKRVDLNNSPQVMQKMLDQSLRDLNFDYIDMYMIHWPDPRVDIRKPMEFLSKEKKKGKILHIGLCNTNPEDLQRALEIDNVDLIQSELNIFTQNAYKNIESYLDEIPFMSWGTLDKGIISGKVKADSKFEKIDARSWAPWWKKSNKDIKISKMEKIEELLTKKGHTGLELALAYNLSFSGVKNILCGIKSIDQLKSILLALKNPPTKSLIQEVLELI